MSSRSLHALNHSSQSPQSIPAQLEQNPVGRGTFDLYSIGVWMNQTFAARDTEEIDGIPLQHAKLVSHS